MKLKPFDLQAALNGEPVMLRNGDKAYIRHYETELPVLRSWEVWGIRIYKGSVDLMNWAHDGRYYLDGEDGLLDIIGMWPKTRIINGFEVPVPEERAPALRSWYLTVDFSEREMILYSLWNNGLIDAAMLKRGLVFLTKEDAIANAKAMLGIDPYAETDE